MCLPAFAYSFCFPFLLFEKRYHNSAGARMGSDHTSYGRIANFFQVSFPDVTAVFDLFYQQRVRHSTVAQQNRPAEINAAGLVDLLNEQIVPHFGAACFSQQLNLAVNN